MSDSQQLKMGPLVILMINMFIAMLGIGLIIPILPKFMSSLGGSGETGGYLVAVFGLTQFLFSPLWENGPINTDVKK